MFTWPKIAALGGSLVGMLFAAVLLARQVNVAFDKGEELSDAKWEAEIARKNVETQKAIEAAKEAGRAEIIEKARAAEARAADAMKALDEARNADPSFDAALRATWPDAYFVSVCGQDPNCLPPN